MFCKVVARRSSMRPEGAQATLTRVTVLWGELEGVYDQLDEHMVSGGWASIDQEARRLDTLHAELAPLVSALAAARSGSAAGSAIDRAWLTLAERGRALAARQRDLTGRIVGARDAVEADLARVRRGRSQTRTYSSATALPPRFTSRRI